MTHGTTKILCRRIRLLSTSSETISQKSDVVSRYFCLLHSSPNSLHLRHLHARLLRTSLYDDVVLSSKLVLMYARLCSLCPDSLYVFHHMPRRNIFSWNIIVGEFSRSNFPAKAVQLFLLMLRSQDVRPNVFTIPLVLRACAGSGAVNAGISVHGLCVKLGLEGNLFVGSALVFMYVNFGRIFDARAVFDEMPERDSVLWTAMLAGYAQHEEPGSALEVYGQMVEAGVEFDWVVMLSLLLVCGQLGWLRQGKSVHGWGLRRCFGLCLNLGNALVDMYVKCTAMAYARKLFDGMPERDVISWSSIIVGYGLSGSVDAAWGLFDEMLMKGLRPNEVTFLGVLSACAHGGLVYRARSCFAMMECYGAVPELKHYACMVDCLGKAGLLEEAEKFVEEMPVEPDGVVLGALLGSCQVHANVEVGERVARKLIDLEPDKAGYYVLLGNIYSAAGRFDDAERLRRFMKQISVSKSPGCSLVESNTCFTQQNKVCQ